MTKEKLFGDKLFAPKEERRVFTNVTDSLILIEDLGVKDPSGRISDMESLNPGETKDLGAYYKDEELLASKSLRRFISEGKIVEGKAEKQVDPNSPAQVLQTLGKHASTFDDPTKNDYDKALTVLNEKEDREDRETRRNAVGGY